MFHTCLNNRKPCTHTEQGSWSVLHIWWSPSPSLTHTICSYRNATQKESSLMEKLINLSRCRSKWCMHACIDDGLVGPQMEASHVSVLARIYMHVAQKGVVWCLNNQFHNFDVARASVTKKSLHWVRCTCSRTHTYSIYASPLPPLRCVLYTTIT